MEWFISLFDACTSRAEKKAQEQKQLREQQQEVHRQLHDILDPNFVEKQLELRQKQQEQQELERLQQQLQQLQQLRQQQEEQQQQPSPSSTPAPSFAPTLASPPPSKFDAKTQVKPPLKVALALLHAHHCTLASPPPLPPAVTTQRWPKPTPTTKNTWLPAPGVQAPPEVCGPAVAAGFYTSVNLARA